MTTHNTCPNQSSPSLARTLLLAVAGAMALLVAACGDSGPSADPVVEPTPAAEETPEAPLELDVESDDTVVETGATTQEVAPEFLELGYWEGVRAGTFSRTVQPPEECDASDPELLVCAFESEFESFGTHIGRAHDVSAGTVTTLLSETCDGPDGATGNPQILDTRGTITTDRGDEIWFHNLSEVCAANGFGNNYWRVVGGTGRFVDASGVMTSVFPVLESGYDSMSVGTLRVRADLWEPTLPPVE